MEKVLYEKREKKLIEMLVHVYRLYKNVHERLLFSAAEELVGKNCK